MIFEGLVLAAAKGIVRARVACLIAENIIKLLSECKVADAKCGVRQTIFVLHFRTFKQPTFTSGVADSRTENCGYKAATHIDE